MAKDRLRKFETSCSDGIVSRNKSRNDERSRIAHHAARLMAEDGIEDHALAKRKAARRAGVPDSRDLPTNDEIDSALREYREIYQFGAHEDRLHALRRQALKVMRAFGAFDPHLAGSVLNGNAGPYAEINVQLYTDGAKGVELFLIGRNIPYSTSQIRLYAGNTWHVFPVFLLDDDGIPIRLVVLDARDLRHAVRTSEQGKAIERVRIDKLEALLAAT